MHESTINNSLSDEAPNKSTMHERGEILYKTHYTPIFRYLFFRLKNREDAEDLAQTVFLKAFKSLDEGSWSDKESTSYLFTIARNTLIDFFRRKKYTPIVSDEIISIAVDTDTTDNPMKTRELEELVARGVSKMREKEKEAVTLRFIAGIPYEEIAQIMGKREDAIRQLVHRGLKSLKGHLEDDGLFK